MCLIADPSPVYTPHYTSLLEQRRTALQTQLDGILPHGTAFTLEVGCGHGHFLTAYAGAHPDTVCIGIDLVGERIDRAARKRDRARLGNLHFIQTEARLFLETLPPTAQLNATFILFPDPWPKLRHNKHRIIQPRFLDSLAVRSELGAPLYFRTDFTPYYDEARDLVAQHACWRLEAEPWPFEYETVFQQRAATFHSLVARCKMHHSPMKPRDGAL